MVLYLKYRKNHNLRRIDQNRFSGMVWKSQNVLNTDKFDSKPNGALDLVPFKASEELLTYALSQVVNFAKEAYLLLPSEETIEVSLVNG
jgi:hypothetical protein